MATALYMRVSTEKQEEHGVSLQTQKERLHAYCTLKGLPNIKEYLDVGSGRTTDKRINFNRMIKDVKDGHITNVVILKLDRLTRSIIDLNKLVHQLNESGCQLHSTTENIDTTTASGRMMLNLIGTFAQWESETISERVKINMQSLTEKGIWQSSVPFGYELVNQKLELNKEEQSILREAFELVLDGYSYAAAEREIKEKYNLGWHRGFLTKKIRSPSTVGDTYRNGLTVRDTHEPIVTKEEQKKLLSLMGSSGYASPVKIDGDLFRRKIICPYCNEIMSACTHRNYRGDKRLYRYACHNCARYNNLHHSVSEKILEDAFKNRLKEGFINIKFDESDVKGNETKGEIDKLKKELKTLERNRKRIQKAWINELMEDNELEEHQTEIDNRAHEIEERLKELDVNTDVLSNEEIIKLQTMLSSTYDAMNKEEKVTFIQRHIKEIHYGRTLIEGFKKRYKTVVTDIVFF